MPTSNLGLLLLLLVFVAALFGYAYGKPNTRAPRPAQPLAKQQVGGLSQSEAKLLVQISAQATSYRMIRTSLGRTSLSPDRLWLLARLITACETLGWPLEQFAAEARRYLASLLHIQSGSAEPSP